MSKCHYCHGKGVLPGFDDSPGDSRFIFCSMCNATGVAQYADPTETHGDPLVIDLCPACIGGGGSEDPATECPVCHGASFVWTEESG